MKTGFPNLTTPSQNLTKSSIEPPHSQRAIAPPHFKNPIAPSHSKP
ncbi:hypothetical protein [Cyanobacterium aponinum]|nr:hypothetical protein [Cyanobacterium aponinum]